MTLAEIKDWAWIVQALTLAIIACLIPYLRGFFATKQAVDKVATELGEAVTRLSVVENQIEALPTASEIRGIRETLAEVAAISRGNENLLHTLHRHLLKSDR